MATQVVKRRLLGLFGEPETAAQAIDSLEEAGIPRSSVEILTGSSYPDGAFGEAPPRHRLFVFPFIGAACGFAVGILLTVGTQLSFPIVTGGKPILSLPPMIIVLYEGTMLGAIIFTVLGILFESRLPVFGVGPYDPRITEGYIGVLVSAPEDRAGTVEQALKEAGAVDIIRDEGRHR